MAADTDIKRRTGTSATATLTLTTDSTSPIIDMNVWAGFGFVITGTTGGAATISYFVARAIKNSDGTNSAGTFGQIYDNTNTAETQAITNGKAYNGPTDSFPFGFVQPRVDAGTATIELSKKS